MMLPFLFIGTRIFRGVLRTYAIVLVCLTIVFIFLLQSMAVLAALVGGVIFSVLVYYISQQKLLEWSGKLRYKYLVVLIATFVVISAGYLLLKSGFIDTYIKKAAIAVQYFSNPEELERTHSKGNDNSVFERLLLTKKSFEMFLEHPITGSGLTNWKILFPTYGISGSNFMITGRLRYEHPHNEYLFLLCESGIFMLIAWLGVLFTSLFYIRKTLISSALTKDQRMFLVLLGGSIISFMIISLFSYPRDRFYTLFLLLTSFAILDTFQKEKVSKYISINKPALLIVLIISVSSLYLHFSHVKSEWYLKFAKHHQYQKKYKEMRYLVNKANTSLFPLDGTSTPLNWYAGHASYYMGEKEEALKYYQAASIDNPYHIHVWKDMGAVQDQLFNYPDAIISYHHSLEVNPYFPEAILNMGLTQYNNGSVDSSLFYLRQYPFDKNPRYRNNLSTVLAASVGRSLAESNDTVLVNSLNNKIAENHYYLVDEYESCGEDEELFLEKIRDLKD